MIDALWSRIRGLSLSWKIVGGALALYLLFLFLGALGGGGPSLVPPFVERGAKLAGLPQGQRLGWHSLRRKFATELKATPLKDLCAMGGWKSPQTVLTCYQCADEETQRTAMAKRVKLRATG